MEKITLKIGEIIIFNKVEHMVLSITDNYNYILLNLEKGGRIELSETTIDKIVIQNLREENKNLKAAFQKELSDFNFIDKEKNEKIKFLKRELADVSSDWSDLKDYVQSAMYRDNSNEAYKEVMKYIELSSIQSAGTDLCV